MRLERFELSTNSLMETEMRFELISFSFRNRITLYYSAKATALPTELQSHLEEQFKVMLGTEIII